MTKLTVVTRVPADGDVGNLAMVAPLFAQVGPMPDQLQPFGGMPALMMRAPVFHLGEVMILDEDGREIGGRGRKPSKWDVDVESFDTIDAAAQRAREVTDA